MARVSSDKLRLARWLRKATQKKVAEKSGLSQAFISKLENGFEIADDAAAAALEQALQVTPGFLCDTGARSSLPEHFYRKRASVLVGDQRWIESVVVLARHGIAALCESVSVEPVFELPQIPVGVESSKTPLDVARQVRCTLMVPDGPILKLEDMIESAGVIIVPIHHAPAKFDAMASPASRDNPWNLIFYNAEMPGDRLRFTLAHEFGHLVMHRSPSDDCEDEADQFASELLTPQKLIRPHLRNLDLNRAVQLKRIWGVSIASLIYQAHAQQCISPSRYKSLQVMISQRGWRKTEPGDIQMPRPQIFREIILAHREQLDYSWNDIGRLFGVSGDEFQHRHFPSERLAAPGRELRVIK